MTKYLLISIQPQHVYNILIGKKTLEIRKMIPKWVFEAIARKETVKALIYCTKKKSGRIFIKKGEELYGQPLERTLIVHHPTFFEMDFGGKIVAQFDLNQIEKIICEKDTDYDYEISYEYVIEIGYNKYDNAGNITPFLNYEYYNSMKICKEACVEYEEMDQYFDAKDGYAMFIKNLKVFDNPKKLTDYCKNWYRGQFYTETLTMAPQNMMAVWGDE